jgi:multiple antibiotic resistance protein
LDTYGFLQALLMLFIILDPIGNAPIFHSLTMHMDKNQRVIIIKKSVAIATLMLLVIGFVGEAFFRFFGITLNDFRIAGGVILFIYGVQGILGKTEAEEISGDSSLAIIPLATPLLAGPGAIATVIYIKYRWGSAIMLGSILIDSILTLAILLLGEKLFKYLGKDGSLLLVKLFSMLLAAIAVNMVGQGIIGYLESH